MNKKPIWVLFLVGCTVQEKTVFVRPSMEMDPLPLAIPMILGSGEDPLLKKQWSIQSLIPTIHEAVEKENRKETVVAILSTGVDYEHEDLEGQVQINLREWQQDGKDSDDNGWVDDVVGVDLVGQDGFAFDRNGMGTAIAGVIAARPWNGKGISGLDGSAKILPIRVISQDGETNVALMIEGLKAAADLKPNIVLVHTVAVELSVQPSAREMELAFINRQLSRLEQLDIPVVVAAGTMNRKFGSTPIEAQFLAKRNVLVVSSLDSEGKVPRFVNTGEGPGFYLAPGEKILTLGLRHQYEERSSTALAAAYIAGRISRYFSKVGVQSTEKMQAALKSGFSPRGEEITVSP